MTNQPLFQEFEPVSAKQWKQKIQYELQGADYNDTLIYKSRDGINIKPFYHAEDSTPTYHIPFPTDWKICERIYVASAKLSNKRACEVLSKGAESLWFVIPTKETNLETLLLNLELDKINIYISLEFLSEEYITRLSSFISERSTNIYLQVDIIANLARSGNWFFNLNQDHQILTNILSSAKNFKSVIGVDATLYQNAGATIPQELAYALAHSNEYLNHFYTARNTFKNQKIQFLISSGSNYFFEIAKIRALRLLYASLASEYQVEENCHILAQPTERDKTLYDYNVNLLRTTTQSMSAILGGADAVYNTPYDGIYHKTNKFGDRIARNQLLILKNESYLDKVSNASEGAYYIESLTLQFAEKALDIFKEVEAGGGFLHQLKEGIIQRKIAESAHQQQEDFDSGKLVLVGTNKYQNREDRMKNDLELYPFLKTNPRKTLIQPILKRRLAEKMEQERIQKE